MHIAGRLPPLPSAGLGLGALSSGRCGILRRSRSRVASSVGALALRRHHQRQQFGTANPTHTWDDVLQAEAALDSAAEQLPGRWSAAVSRLSRGGASGSAIVPSPVGWGSLLRPGTDPKLAQAEIAQALDVAELGGHLLPVVDLAPVHHAMPYAYAEADYDDGIRKALESVGGGSGLVSLASLRLPVRLISEYAAGRPEPDSAGQVVLTLVRQLLKERLGGSPELQRGGQPAVDVLLLQNAVEWFGEEDGQLRSPEEAGWVIRGLELAVQEGLIGGYGLNARNSIRQGEFNLERAFAVAEAEAARLGLARSNLCAVEASVNLVDCALLVDRNCRLPASAGEEDETGSGYRMVTTEEFAHHHGLAVIGTSPFDGVIDRGGGQPPIPLRLEFVEGTNDLDGTAVASRLSQDLQHAIGLEQSYAETLEKLSPADRSGLPSPDEVEFGALIRCNAPELLNLRGLEFRWEAELGPGIQDVVARTREHHRTSQWSDAYGRQMLERVYRGLLRSARLNDSVPVQLLSDFLDQECQELRGYGRLELKGAALLIACGRLDLILCDTPSVFRTLVQAMASKPEFRGLPEPNQAVELLEDCSEIVVRGFAETRSRNLPEAGQSNQ